MDETKELRSIRNLIIDDTDNYLENDKPMPYFTIEYHGVKASFPLDLADMNEYFLGLIDETIDFLSMNGLYKVRLETKDGQSRQEVIADYFDNLADNEDMAILLADEIDSEEYYKALGSWSMNVFDKFMGNRFEVLFVVKKDQLTRYWFIDSDNTIRQKIVEN